MRAAGRLNRAGLLPLLAALALGGPGFGRQEQVETVTAVEPGGRYSFWDSPNLAQVRRGINVENAATLERGRLLFSVDHRTRQPVDNDPVDNMAGFDGGGLKVGLGLRYGLLDRLEAGFYRLNGTLEAFDTYSLDLKYALLEERRQGIALAVRAGVCWFSEDRPQGESGELLQLLAHRTFGDRVRLGTGLLYHSESTGPFKPAGADDWSLAVPLQVGIRLTGRLAWELEAIPAVGGYRQAHPVFATGLKVLTQGHNFILTIGNSQYIGPDGIVTNSNRDFGQLVVGFTITRELF